jgi:hypothetical protein
MTSQRKIEANRKNARARRAEIEGGQGTIGPQRASSRLGGADLG